MSFEGVIMQCGHSANGVRRYSDGREVKCCTICHYPKNETPMKPQPSMENRIAKCPDCGKIIASSPDLAFFEYRPRMRYDSFYCGCRGWD